MSKTAAALAMNNLKPATAFMGKSRASQPSNGIHASAATSQITRHFLVGRKVLSDRAIAMCIKILKSKIFPEITNDSAKTVLAMEVFLMREGLAR